MQRLAQVVLWMVALFYLYGASVHVLNILSQTGFNWKDAPLKWQILDVVYLVLDVLVVAGIIAKWRIGLVAFYLAATSQIVLYTVLRDWVLAVPQEFAVSEDQRSYLTTLVYFHLVTLVLVTGALVIRSRSDVR